jgi:triosephosphate isomerase
MAGNWKMNLSLQEATGLVQALRERCADPPDVDILVAPPFTSLHRVREAIGDAGIFLAGQNMHWESKGAYTGEISAQMLLEAGCSHVILGHSERRALFGETDEGIDKKARAAVAAGLAPIVCIGETLEEREAGRTFQIIEGQLGGSLAGFADQKNLPVSVVIAYEPVWAIGTGKTATPDQAQEVQARIRQWIAGRFGKKSADALRILYGGSVKPDNVADLMGRPDIDGALVGGASLRPDAFVPIVRFRDAQAG